MTDSLPDTETPQQALRSLEQDVKHLHESMTFLHGIVYDQQPQLDSIQDAIIHSKEQSQSARQDLQQAEAYQASTRSMNGLLAFTGLIATGIVYLLL